MRQPARLRCPREPGPDGPPADHRPPAAGEDLILPSAATWWCGDGEGLSHALTHLERLLIKRIDRSGGDTTIPAGS
ncbi:circularly permuted type 2 ATP-grasp protein [Tessaracoccus sp. HDW20]|nr:circularly permuted type 2 ATP-grasp protein [Tessaracoccus coleopterorum]